ncbi:FAD-binding protein [Flexivirga sp. ID2601S]|uniref:FAD-binding protein n=1 Tax=Flexivirga aerilata TaxID=1656889 RepID=A0A849ARR2_9MICO|nr:FAD-dependent oxidoreductase [Flexivirga aerilata]NNG40970.1 FAD-binding protein [Flexivirga aerilata]
MQTITRRGALMAATASLTSGLAAISDPPADAAAGAPSRADWVAFARTVAGPVYLPGTASYTTGKQLFDRRFDGSTPAAVMVVQRSADIGRAMAFTRRFGMQVTARSGGHSYVGASAAARTLVLDLRPLRSVSYDPSSGTVLVGAGAGLFDVKRQLAARGRALPTGTCPTVGVSGLTLGGGLGVESRAHGLTCDRLVAATMTLPDGRSITVDAAHSPGAFWALRGGGGGNLGVVTALRFATHAATAKGIFTLTFAGSAAARVVTGWARWVASAPRSQWAGVHLDALGNGRLHVSILGVTEAGAERSAAAAVRSAVGVAPVGQSYRRLSYLDTAVYLGGGTTSARQGFVGGSDVFARLDADAAAAIVAAVTGRSRAGGTGSALLDPLTGAVGDPAPTATAFPWRNHLASLQWYVGVGAPSGYASAAAWIGTAHRAVGRWSSGGYVNYLETGQPAARYYAGNLPRLAQLRAAYDPGRRVHSGLTF